MGIINWDVMAASAVNAASTTDRAIEKATGDVAVSDLSGSGGYLSTADSESFWKKTVEASELISMGTIAPMKSHTQNFPIIGFNSRISHLHGAGSALVSAQRAKPDLDTVQLASQAYTAEIDIPDDVLEDNVSGEAFKNLVIDLAKTRIGADIELLGLASDTGSSTTDFTGFNGIIASISTNTVDAGDAGLTRSICQQMLQSMDSKDKQDKSKLRIITSTNAAEYYEDKFFQRATPGADAGFMQGIEYKPAYNRVAIKGIPLMPENLGTGSNRTCALLGNPAGIYWGFWRKVKIEMQRVATEQKTIVVFSYRFTAKPADETEWVRAYDIDPTP